MRRFQALYRNGQARTIEAATRELATAVAEADQPTIGADLYDLSDMGPLVQDGIPSANDATNSAPSTDSSEGTVADRGQGEN